MGFFILFCILVVSLVLSIHFSISARRSKKDMESFEERVPDWLLRDHFFATIGKWISMAVFALIAITLSVTIVPSGAVKVLTTFGRVNVQDAPLPEGAHLKLPWQSAHQMSVRQQTFDRNAINDNQMEVIVGDGVTLTMDVSFHWILNPSAAALVYQKFGDRYFERLQIPSAASAIRDVIGSMDEWLNVINNKSQVEQLVTDRFARVVRSKLSASGIPDEITKIAFTFPKVDIRRATPPKAIRQAVAAKKAAQQQLERQETEVKIAAAKAQKGVSEGQRMRYILLALFNDAKNGVLPDDAKLPEGLAPADVAMLMQALAAKQNAQSVQQATESEGVQTILLPATSPVAVGVK